MCTIVTCQGGSEVLAGQIPADGNNSRAINSSNRNALIACSKLYLCGQWPQLEGFLSS